jgi:hypothetical protein
MRIILLLVVFSSVVAAQRSVSDLSPAHAAALERYMSANKGLTFRSENNLGGDYLKVMRETFGKNFKPNYAVADFNRDKIKDFAVLLYRAGKPVRIKGITGEEHAVEHPLRIVVFNGAGNGFRVAYSKDLAGPAAAFIKFDKKLGYGVFETDDTFMLRPAGRGYAVEFARDTF